MTNQKMEVTIVMTACAAAIPVPAAGHACFVAESTNGNSPVSSTKPRTTGWNSKLRSRGFRALREACRVTVITDSQYVQRGMTEFLPGWKQNGWLKSNRDPVLNRGLREQLDSVTQPHEVTWKWIRGHNGHPDQERCDRLAASAIHHLQTA